MSVILKSTDGPVAKDIESGNFNSTYSDAGELYSLLDAVDSEFIADKFDIDKNNEKHDFDIHLKVAVCEGFDPLSFFVERADKIETDKQPKRGLFGFSGYTNGRDYRAVVRFLFLLVVSPRLMQYRSGSPAQWSSLTSLSVTASNPTRSTQVVVELTPLLRMQTVTTKHPLGTTATEGRHTSVRSSIISYSTISLRVSKVALISAENI